MVQLTCITKLNYAYIDLTIWGQYHFSQTGNIGKIRIDKNFRCFRIRTKTCKLKNRVFIYIAIKYTNPTKIR